MNSKAAGYGLPRPYSSGDVISNIRLLQPDKNVAGLMMITVASLLWEIFVLQDVRPGDRLSSALFDVPSLGSWVKAEIQSSLNTLHCYQRQVHADDSHAAALCRLVLLLTICGYNLPMDGSLGALFKDPEFSKFIEGYMQLSNNRMSYLTAFSSLSVLSGLVVPSFSVQGDDRVIGYTVLTFVSYALQKLKTKLTTFPDSFQMLTAALDMQTEVNKTFDLLEFLGILLVHMCMIFRIPGPDYNDDLSYHVCVLTHAFYVQCRKYGMKVSQLAIDNRAYMIRKMDDAIPISFPYEFAIYACITVFYVLLIALVDDKAMALICTFDGRRCNELGLVKF